MMERTAVDRRPGMAVPVKKPIRTSRFVHLAKSGPPEESLLTSSSMTLAAFITIALLFGCDSYFFDGYYSSAAFSRSAGLFVFDCGGSPNEYAREVSRLGFSIDRPMAFGGEHRDVILHFD